jgi:hypothetical protein
VRYALPAAAALAAAIAAAVVILAGSSGSGGPPTASAAVVHHALRAVTPPAHTILHVKVVGVQNGVQIMGESWQETSPPYASRGMKGEAGHLGEFADDGTTSYEYDPGSNTIYEQPDSSPPTFTDPISAVQQQLAGGQAQLAGTTVIDGQSLYAIDLPSGVVAYFDKSTYTPRYLDDPQHGGGVVRLTVVAYEHLAATPQNVRLLDLKAEHPGAHIDTNPSDAPGK